MSRGLSSDTCFSGRELFAVNLTHSQWAALVSGGHSYAGVPVTIDHCNTEGFKQMPMIAAPEVSKKELHGLEMAEGLRRRLQAMESRVAALGAALDSGAGKKELRAIHEALKLHVEHLPGSVQFVYDQFADATETVANQAKTEVEGYVNAVVHGLGLKSLSELPRLTAEKGAS